MKIGVLALQGGFIEHISVMQQLGIEASPIRLPDQLDNLDELIIPGGESTTILQLMRSFGFVQPFRELANEGLPILGTCTGMICLAKKVSNHAMETLAVMDIVVQRNAFSRQIDSFEAELTIPVLGGKPFPVVFIRSPFIDGVGPKIEVLARLPSGVLVACKQENLMATAFHPELTGDLRSHSYFLSTVSQYLLGGPGDRARRT